MSYAGVSAQSNLLRHLRHGHGAGCLICVGLLALSLTGCAYLHSTTEDANGIKTSVRAYALFDSHNQLLKFANRGTLTQSNQWVDSTRRVPRAIW